MVETMRKKGIREGLIKRVEEVVRETKSRENGERDFWTARGGNRVESATF